MDNKNPTTSEPNNSDPSNNLNPVNPPMDQPAQTATGWPSSPAPTQPEPVTSGEPVPTFVPQPDLNQTPPVSPVSVSGLTGDLGQYPLQPNSADIGSAQLQPTPAGFPTPSLSQPLQSQPPNQSTFNPASIVPISPADSALTPPTLPQSDIPQPPASEQTPPDLQNPAQDQNFPQPSQFESAPTDLSHLITNTSDIPQPAETNQPSASVPENLVIQPSVNPDIPNIPGVENHKGIPKWLIGIGIGLLLIVIGASAFFILGVGQPSKTTSLPATQTSKSTPKPSPTTTPQKTPQPSGTTGFGQFEGSPAATLAPTPKPATSAAELLKQRQ